MCEHSTKIDKAKRVEDGNENKAGGDGIGGLSHVADQIEIA
jgi:hypothetical protein